MTDAAMTYPEPKTKAEYEATVRQMLEAMERMNAKMALDRGEIERLKADTRSTLAELGVRL